MKFNFSDHMHTAFLVLDKFYFFIIKLVEHAKFKKIYLFITVPRRFGLKKNRLTRSLYLFIKMVRVTGVEPASLSAPDSKSGASANSAIPAHYKMVDPVGLEPTTARL